MVHYGSGDGVVVHDVAVSGKDVHLSAVKQSEHPVSIDDRVLFAPARYRAVLGNEDVGILRNVSEQLLHELQHLLGITLLVLLFLNVHDVVQTDVQVLAHKESVVVRAEILEIVLGIIAELTLFVVIVISSH